ncbi:hypothetical protein [Flavobacterium okayamense]|uniref:Uncharacterized protein n=1 Tax=Flavobacterium okayamense TaxID=2830782 RepID=A0ABN6I193_9FLAO|nr:hypothetical protein [Flavobacterium okayamense]BCY29027.1 hypothetical protein KK2020170_18950 [Flavobacterium okayamense]
MKTHFLFPNQFKIVGWILFVPSLIISILATILEWNIDEYFNIKVFAIYNDEFFQKNSSKFFQIIENSISDELLTFALIIGGILIGFSKLKSEDEMIGKIRYESLVWATYFNYTMLLLFTAFMYGISFLNVLFYNTFTLLLFFIIRFHYMIYKLNKQNSDEE